VLGLRERVGLTGHVMRTGLYFSVSKMHGIGGALVVPLTLPSLLSLP
jgi:hypothetical protein